MMNRVALVLAALALALVLAGCADRDASSAASPPYEPEAKAEAAEEQGIAQASAAPAPVEADQVRARKLIQNAELHVEVDAYPATRRKLDALLASVGGFVADAQIDHRDGEVSRATLTLRVPSDKLAVFLDEAAGSGKVIHERLTAKDITEGYYDTQARLKNAKRVEARLVEILGAQASTMKDLLEVERELARVREEIERHEGRIRLWDQQVGLSTVELTLVTHQTYVAATPPTLGERLHAALSGSFGALVGVGKALVVFLAALLPWLLPLALLVFGGRAVARRLLRRRVAPPQTVTP